VVLAPAASEPLYDALVTVSAPAAFGVTTPFQTWFTVWPEPRPQLTVQPETAVVPALTLTSPWNPPCQVPVTRYVAVHWRPGVPVGVTEGVTDGVTLGVIDGVIDGVTDGVTLGVIDGVTEGVTDGVTDGVTEGVGEPVDPPLVV